jgi:ElaB/YqjD/DUF883 family membrane-anchored ribosome-binding protein
MATTADPTDVHGTNVNPKSGGDHAGNHSTVNRFTEKAHETVDRVAASAENAEDSLRAHAADAEARMREMGAKITDATHENTEHLRSYVRDNPLTSAGIAFAVGYVISAIMRR